MNRPLLLLVPLFVLACSGKGEGDSDVDTDGDGLLDSEEAELGTDPALADTDADGLSDADEVDQGIDPLLADTDADGYLDGWEVTEGSDPLDDQSLIYAGGWPYNPDKDSLGAPDYDDTDTDIGDAAPRFALMDQFGDTVDVYDFYNTDGKYVIVDLSAVWCGPCNGFAAWLSGDPAYESYDAEWPNLREMVENGEIYWLTVLGEDKRGNVPDIDDLTDWYDDYPDDNIPVLGVEKDSAFVDFYLDAGWPSIYLYSPDLVLQTVPGDPNDYTQYYEAIFDADALGD